MSFKATFDIAVNFSFFKIKDFHKTGSLHYKASVYYVQRSDPKKEKKFAYPSNICFEKLSYSETLKEHNLILINTLNEPYITEDQVHFVSREFPVNFINRNFAENTTCYWKVHINVQKIQLIDFFIQVQLIFKDCEKDQHSKNINFQSIQSKYSKDSEIISTYKGKINKQYDVFSYLPICFDQLGSLQLNSTYHAIISEFKFSSDEEEQFQREKQDSLFFLFAKKHSKLKYGSFKGYFEHLTQNCLSSKVKTFYCFYKDYLTNTYESLLKRKNTYKKITQKGIKNFKKSGQKKLVVEKLSDNFDRQFNLMYQNHQDLKQFQESKQILSDIITGDYSILAQKIYVQWVDFNSMIKNHSYKITQHDQKLYIPLLQQRYKNNIFSHRVKIQKSRDFTFSRYDDSGRSHLQQARRQNEKRISESDVWSGHFLVQDKAFEEKEQKNLKMFQEKYEIEQTFDGMKRSKTQQNIRYSSEIEIYSEDLNKKLTTLHIIFLVHGFGACKMDMLLLKSFIELKYNAQVIISVQNIGRTEETIEASGFRLADEVKKHLAQVKQNFRLSFIGHSMGGLIIRSAIPRLQKYRQNFHTYISICTPHLGYLYEPPSLIKVGLWMLSQIQKCDSLNQVEMKDHKNLRRCYLYNLSMNDSLKWFKNVAFVASSQDSYVPYESARIEKSERILGQMQTNDKERVEVIKQMIDKILGNLKQAKQISRIDVIFNIEETTFSSLIGRVGHVKFLSDEQFIKEFVICFRRFFQ